MDKPLQLDKTDQSGKTDLLEVCCDGANIGDTDQTRTRSYRAQCLGIIGKPIATTRELIDKICTLLMATYPAKKIHAVPIYAVYT